MLFQRTRVWFPTSTPGGSQLPTFPALGILTSFSGSVGTCTRVHSYIPSHRHTHINKNKSKKKRLNSVTSQSQNSAKADHYTSSLHCHLSLIDPALLTHISCLLFRAECECSPPPKGSCGPALGPQLVVML